MPTITVYTDQKRPKEILITKKLKITEDKYSIGGLNLDLSSLGSITLKSAFPFIILEGKRINGQVKNNKLILSRGPIELANNTDLSNSTINLTVIYSILEEVI